MEYGHDIRCPKCGDQHGPAAKSCDCGHIFTKPREDPAPPAHFFLLALFFGAVSAGAVIVARNNGRVYFPLGGSLFTLVATALGIRSWFFFLRRKYMDRKSAEQNPNASRLDADYDVSDEEVAERAREAKSGEVATIPIEELRKGVFSDRGLE